MIQSFFRKLIFSSYDQNNKNIIELCEKNSQANFLDLGCDDGEWTCKVAESIGTKKLFGVEIFKPRANEATKKGIFVSNTDLNNTVPFNKNYFDVIHANQVIEHIYDTDFFIEEIYRLLKPNGYAIISTENLASWHNIIALMFGYQPFSMANYSRKGNIGNPFSLGNSKLSNNTSPIESWLHSRLFSYYGLKDLFKKHGFRVEKILCAGYYPMPGFFAKYNPIHGHWITIKVRK